MRGGLSLAAAMKNAKVTFMDPVMADGAKVSSQDFEIWSKEFDLLIASCKTKTNGAFRRLFLAPIKCRRDLQAPKVFC